MAESPMMHVFTRCEEALVFVRYSMWRGRRRRAGGRRGCWGGRSLSAVTRVNLMPDDLNHYNYTALQRQSAVSAVTSGELWLWLHSSRLSFILPMSFWNHSSQLICVYVYYVGRLGWHLVYIPPLWIALRHRQEMESWHFVLHQRLSSLERNRISIE